MKIDSKVVERLMSQLGIKAEEMRVRLGFTSVEGFNKILREGSTKDKTALKIADELRVHISVISGEKLRHQKSLFIQSDDEREIFKMKNMIDKHDIEIADLKEKYTKLLEKLQGLN